MLETRVREGENIVAVLTNTPLNGQCRHCVFGVPRDEFLTECKALQNHYPCYASNRHDRESIFYMREDDTLKARIRGKV